MMFHGLGLIHRNQRGFTIIELLIAFALTGIVAGATTTTIVQVINGSSRSSNHMTAVRQVQNAGYWVSRDAQMAQDVVITGVSGFPLTLTWTDWDSVAHQVVYELEDMPSGGLKNLRRSHYIDSVLDETGVVAQYIDPAETNCEFADGSAFSLPDSGDAFTITGGATADNGTITVTAGSVTATPTGDATVAGGAIPAPIDPASGAVAWTTPNAGDTVLITATSTNTIASWTSTTGTATATITTDTNGDATVTGSVLIFTVTATVGSDSQEGSETREYRTVSRPSI